MFRNTPRVVGPILMLVLVIAVAACGSTGTPATPGPTEPTLSTPSSTGPASTEALGQIDSTTLPSSTPPSPPTPPPAPPSTVPTEGSGHPAATEPPSESLDAQGAVRVALANVSGGAVVEIERDTHKGQPIWEVLVRDLEGRGVELDIDSSTGNVIGRKPKELPRYARDSAPAIDISAALAQALAMTPGTIKEAELERSKGGRLVWEVEIIEPNGRKVEHLLDAATGEVIR